MDDLPVKHPGLLNQNSTLSYKTLTFYLKLLLLLVNVIHNQSLMQYCPIRTAVDPLPNFTSEAGCPFFFKLPLPTTLGHIHHYQLSRADEDSTLPHWMVFGHQTSSLAGLALAEDCGIYHLKVFLSSKDCAIYFYLHILNGTVTDKDPARDALSCSKGEMSTWANILIQLNPETLDASQRIKLVTTMSDYIHQPFVYLFSRRKSFTLQQEKLNVCRQGRFAANLDAMGDVGELLWSVGCQGEEGQSDLAKLESKLSTLPMHMKQIEAKLEPTHTQDSPENTVSKDFSGLQGDTSLSGSQFTFRIYNSQKYTKTTFSTSKIPLVEITGCSEQAPESALDTLLVPNLCVKCSLLDSALPTTSLLSTRKHKNPSLFLPATFRNVVDTMLFGEPLYATPLSTLLPSSRPHSSYPSLPLTLLSNNVTSTLTHEADRESLTTRPTLRPHQKETPLWTGSYRASHPDSESQSTLSSQEHYNDAMLLNSRLKTIQSLPLSNKIPTTQQSPDVSPTSCLMTKQLSVAQHSDTIQHLSKAPSVNNQDVMSQLNETTQDVSSTTLAGQLTLSGKAELESSLSTSLLDSLEPSVTTFTPALPSDLDLLSGQFETPNITDTVFSEESLKGSSSLMPLLQTFSKSIIPDISASSLQLVSRGVTDLQSKSGTQMGFNQNTLTQTLNSAIVSVSLSQTHPYKPCHPLQMSLPLTESLQISSDILTLFKEHDFEIKISQSRVLYTVSKDQATHEKIQYKDSSLAQTTRQQTLGPSVIDQIPLSIFKSTGPVTDVSNPTTQERHTTASIPQMQSLDPSFEFCDNSVANDPVYVSVCNPTLSSIYPKNTVDQVQLFLTSDLQNEKYWTAFSSKFLTFDSSEQFFSTQTLVDYLLLHPTSLPSEINHVTDTQQMDISDTHPYTSSTHSTSALNRNSFGNSLYICQSSFKDSSRPITEGLPSPQILSTSYGMSTTLTSLLVMAMSSSTRWSSVKPSRSSVSDSNIMNLPPKVLQSLPALMATVGFPFQYSIPSKTFLDPEDGEADALSLELRLIDGPPVSVGSWLAMDGLELHGIPLEVDLQFAPQHLLLAARDHQGLSAWLPLTLDLRRSPVQPCHIFTLTAQRSLHSVLRHRHKVELLLRKLSGFFNSSSSHHLSVISMVPGSIMVSWYNYSLCKMDHDRITQCHVDKIQRMWLAMSSVEGRVNPAFGEAMLPEFPITKVGRVSYRHDCISTTPTSTFGGLTPAVYTTLNPGTNTYVSSAVTTATAQQINSCQWMAGMFTALLVVCLLILIVILIAAVLYFCRGRSRTVAIWPACRLVSAQNRDLRAIRPRLPPISQPELPPPPLRLWINFAQGDEGPLPSACEQQRKTLDKALHPHPPQDTRFFSSI
ncbi:hypothetical protein PAMP_015009 [Pampus punctatissimus]